MKRVILALVALWTFTTASRAETYPYLTFELTDGTKASVGVSSLSLTFNGTTLTAGTQTFVISNLNKMYFSTTNETTGISRITADDINAATAIYDLKGRRVSKEQMQRGVYIVKTSDGTFKVSVR